MKLITEVVENIKLDISEGNIPGTRDYFIEGIFLQGNIKNRNGRQYPTEILVKEVSRYNAHYIKQNRAFGELGHPNGPGINLDRASHLITELRQDGNNFIGRAKIMETPMGLIVKRLMDEGAKFGVSSRGMGSMKKVGNINIVQSDFYLATAADIVADPSAPGAFVNGIMEGREWVMDNGIIMEKDMEQYKSLLNKVAKAKRNKTEKIIIKIWEDFCKKL